jgi:uncharacterized protein
MLAPGPAKKIIIHLNDDTSSVHNFLHKEILSFLFQKGVAGASVIRPQSGFGSHHQLHASHSEGVTGEHLPVRIEFIETESKVAELLPALLELVTDGLIEMHDTTILKAASHSGQS